MKKHIEKIENITTLNIDNLTIEKLGHFNLFCGKYENGYNDILNFTNGRTDDVKIIDDILYLTHHSELHKEIRFYFNNIKKYNQQIFATTQRLDVIQEFAEVAQEYKDVEAYYYRLGRSERDSNKGQSIVTMYDTDRLLELTQQNIEVR
jgi:hypothetical protein